MVVFPNVAVIGRLTSEFSTIGISRTKIWQCESRKVLTKFTVLSRICLCLTGLYRSAKLASEMPRQAGLKYHVTDSASLISA